MSLFGPFNAGVSGLLAQTTLLSTIGENVANASTAGYKRAGVAFVTMLGGQAAPDYGSGGVRSRIRYSVGDQGTLTSTRSVTDLAVRGAGFFVVQGTGGATALTRAGSFVPDADGDLVNAAGYKLMGYDLTGGPWATENDPVELRAVNLGHGLDAAPSRSGTLQFNLDSGAPVRAGPLPSADAADARTNAEAAGSSKTSFVAYDDLGQAVTLDLYLTKTRDATAALLDPDGTLAEAAKPAQWEATVYDRARATGNGYASGPLGTRTIEYDGTTGKASTSPPALTVAVPGGRALTIDFGRSTQMAAPFAVGYVAVDGSAPSRLDHVAIGADGTLTKVYADGISEAAYRIPLADVPSPDDLVPMSADVYGVVAASGTMTVGTAQSGRLGAIASGNLENATVDLAAELTAMISAQRAYEADSRVVRNSADLLEVVDRLSG